MRTVSAEAADPRSGKPISDQSRTSSSNRPWTHLASSEKETQ